jgi:DNA replication licensing factor MCM2
MNFIWFVSQSGGIAIAVRHIESIIRISEAYAKMHLRNNVNDCDIDFGIRVVLNSFLNTQKLSVMKILQRKFSE